MLNTESSEDLQPAKNVKKLSQAHSTKSVRHFSNCTKSSPQWNGSLSQIQWVWEAWDTGYFHCLVDKIADKLEKEWHN